MNLKLRARWQDFWFSQIHPHPLALLRIVLALFLLVYWLVYLPRTALLFSSAGLVVPYTELITPLSPFGTTLVCLLLLYTIVMFGLGWQLRLHGAVLGIMLIYYYLLSFHSFPSTYNRLILFTVIILTYSGCDKALSLRMKLEQGSWLAWELIPAWPQRLLAVQITLTYLGAGIQKLILVSWQGGEIIYYSLIGRWGTKAGFWLANLGLPLIFYDGLSVLTKFIHLTAPIGLWLPRLRLMYIGLLSGFHLAVTLFMGMWWFLLFIPLYIVFLKPEVIFNWIIKRAPSGAL